MPVHRHLHDKMGSVYALRSELDAWSLNRSVAALPISATGGQEPTDADVEPLRDVTAPASIPRGSRSALIAFAVCGVAAAVVLWRLEQTDFFWKNPIADAKFVQVTNLDGPEQSVALSRDGKFVAFLANRDGAVSVWMTQVGTGEFRNLTRGITRELVNPSVRTLDFSPDGALVTFWTRKADGSPTSGIGVWAVPILGGEPRPYLDGAAEFDWTADGGRLVYHTPEPGDPMFVKDGRGTADSRRIFAAPAGLHGHFVVWSPDQAFIYFVQGSPPDRMDLWRIKPSGGAPERMTQHDSRVSHPVFLNSRTLLYLATDSSGGPWIYAMDVNRRRPHRVSAGIDTFTSLSASADGHRLAATLATTKTSLWRFSAAGTGFDMSLGSAVALSTSNGSSPRLGPGYLVYVSSQSTSDSIWRKQGDTTTELWTASEARVVGAPAIDPDGRRIAFVTRVGGRNVLYMMNADGTDARVLDKSLEWEGDPSWTPDGRAITATALEAGVPHLFTAALDGHAPAAFGREPALDPVWSPDGRFVVFSGPDIGTTFPVRAMSAAGGHYNLPGLTLSRGARHIRFLPGGRSIAVLRGEIRHMNVWSVDLDTGAQHQLTDVPADFEIRAFDTSADGHELVLERAEQHSAVVLLDLR